MPIGGASELDANPIKAMRLLGEDLVLYKDLGGNYGLIDRHCPHRRADLSYGFVEETGIRCNYHGWLMDERGNVHRAALRRHRQSARQGARALPRQGLSGEGMRGAAVRLYGPAAGAGAAGVGAVHLGERLSRGGDLRHSLQLVPVPGELLRSRAFRMDARELETRGSTARPRPMRPSTSSWCSRNSSTASSTSACARARRTAIRSGPSAA